MLPVIALIVLSFVPQQSTCAEYLASVAYVETWTRECLKTAAWCHMDMPYPRYDCEESQLTNSIWLPIRKIHTAPGILSDDVSIACNFNGEIVGEVRKLQTYRGLDKSLNTLESPVLWTAHVQPYNQRLFETQYAALVVAEKQATQVCGWNEPKNPDTGQLDMAGQDSLDPSRKDFYPGWQHTLPDIWELPDLQEALPTELDVPAIESKRTVNPISGQLPFENRCMECSYEVTDHSCTDKTRFLLQSEDGKYHCLKLSPTESGWKLLR